MQNSDMAFFHKATKIICGSLDLHKVLQLTLDFFKHYMPVDSVGMSIYDSRTQTIVNIASVGTPDMQLPTTPVNLSSEAVIAMENEGDGASEILNRLKDDVLGRIVLEKMDVKEVSVLVLKLVVDDQKLGVLAFAARGHDKYSKEHERLLKLVHDPAAIALSNHLQHKEVLKLKELLEDDNQYLNRQLHRIAGDEIIGSDFGLKHVMEMVRQIAPQKSLVLLMGETGVGKEVIANAIHYSSPRAGGPFIKVNCGAIPESLIDSELFGYEKGAFTGALSLKRGLFERADKGTIFLDEIGELPQTAQVRLLRVLQNKEIERVGGNSPIPVDIRVITATHRDLPQMIDQGQFREDLWFRLNVFPITIPPLRQRKSDILALTQYFLEKKGQEMNLRKQPVLAPGALDRLQAYHWPGNVRELENIVERTIIRNMLETPSRDLEFSSLDSTSPINQKQVEHNKPKGPILLDDVTRQHILEVLKMADGKVKGKNGAATLLGVNPSTLRNKMQKLNIPYGRDVKVG
ncbi:sigma-54 interaction domain-containing protein [Desulforhopalus sp. 52FAK]